MPEPVIVIGAGPAGLAAGMQMIRQGVEVLVFERGKPGGLLHNANWVENYPGFPKGINGPKLVKLIEKQAANHQVPIISEEVRQVSWEGERFQVETEAGAYFSRFLVVASGTQPRPFPDLEIPSELAKRVVYEVYPLLGIKDRRVVIIGAGDAAFDYALNLAQHNHVVILNRGEKLRCLPLLKKRADKHARIDYRTHTQVRQVLAGAGGGLRLVCRGAAGDFELEADHLLGAIGRVESLGFLSDKIGQKMVDLTAKKLIYLVGDVNNGRYRQTAIAVGEGIKAAMEISEIIKEAER